MKRKIGINFNCYNEPVPADVQVSLMKKEGFEACFSGSENQLLGEYMTALRGSGIVCDNLHAPFDKINDIWIPGEDGDRMCERLVESVRICAKYDIPAMVVHLSSGTKPPHVNDIGCERFSKLMDEAAKYGVLICYENQRKLSNLAFAFEQFPAARFCWDCGHEFCFTPGRHYMPIFGDKLSALHIHDNKRELNGDNHMIPYDAKIDFGYVARMISESGYTGTVMLEILRRKTDFYANYSPEQYFARAGAAARRLRDETDAIDTY